VNFFGGWELTQRFVSWVTLDKEVWLFLKVGRWDFFFKNQGIIFLVVWDGWLEKGGWYFYFYFFGV